MDRYNHWLAKLVVRLNRRKGWKEAAITIGQTAYYSCDESMVDAAWHAHEDEHKRQWKQDGWIKFTWNYLRWAWQYGYEKIPYEVEAQEAANEVQNMGKDVK